MRAFLNDEFYSENIIPLSARKKRSKYRYTYVLRNSIITVYTRKSPNHHPLPIHYTPHLSRSSRSFLSVCMCVCIYTLHGAKECARAPLSLTPPPPLSLSLSRARHPLFSRRAAFLYRFAPTTDIREMITRAARARR